MGYVFRHSAVLVILVFLFLIIPLNATARPIDKPDDPITPTPTAVPEEPRRPLWIDNLCLGLESAVASAVDGFDPPIGYRRHVWPSGWYDANPFSAQYTRPGIGVEYHTGVDLNLASGGASDLGQPVYATADGLVTYAEKTAVWGNLVVIRHTMPDGSRVYSRYGHLGDILTKRGAQVTRGEWIGGIGRGDDPNMSPHLHFDISTTDRLLESPGDWPGTDIRQLRWDYVDPARFIMLHRPVTCN